MILVHKNLMIRDAEASDAEQLCIWWNNGKVMAHAGFPNGVGDTSERIRESLAEDSDETHRRHIIELGGKPIGEMNYRNKGCETAEIGIKICEFAEQNKGYGAQLLSMFIDALFTYYKYKKVILDTNIKNKRAQNVYENKLGFHRIGIRENSWRDQTGELQSAVDYELSKEDWSLSNMRPINYTRLRLERPADYRAIEELTREAFWNNSRHVCDEHLLVHRLRMSDSFVPELDYVAEVGEDIAGHIIYSKSRIEGVNGKIYETLTFGPLSVLPDLHFKGIGKALLLYSIGKARRLGYRAILIFGHPDYYPRVGFRRAAEFNITTADDKNFDPFMALPLYNGALDGVQGKYYYDPVYDNLSENDVLEFDKGFPPKERYVPIPISVLLDRLEPDAKKAVQGLGCQFLDDIRPKSEREIKLLGSIDQKAISTIYEVMAEYHYRWGKVGE